MSHPLKKKCGEPVVNQRCATFQQHGDPMLASSSTPAPGPFGGEDDAGLGSAPASSTTASTATTSSLNSTAHPGAYGDASFAAKTNYRTPTASNITYPSDYWRRNLMGNSMYNSYSPSMYGQIPMYPPSGGPSSCLPFTLQSGYGAPQTMFNSATPPSAETAGLLQYAHEQSRGAFDKAAYAIQTVGSITHMLDTIFMGCTGSFNAILTVISQLSQLKNHFGRAISAFAVLRSIRWLYARMLRALGLRSAQDVEEAWREAMESMAAQQSASGGGGRNRNRGSWRRAVLVACLCALPALLWQLMKVMTQDAYDGANKTLGHTGEQDSPARSDGETTGAPLHQGVSGSDPRVVPNAGGYLPPINPAYGSLGGYGTPSMTAGTYPYGANSGGYNPYMGGGSLFGGYTPTGYPSSYNASPYSNSYASYGSPYPSYNSSGSNYYTGIGTAQSFNSNSAANGLRSYGGGVPSNSVSQRRFHGQPQSGVQSQNDLVGKEAPKSVHFVDQTNGASNAPTTAARSDST